MSIRIVRLGTPRAKNEGLRLGTVRRPPRGVKKEDYARLDYYDVWLPELSPSQELVSWALGEEWTESRWKQFEKKYRSEMRDQERLLTLLAALSKQTNLAAGCYCEDGDRCHRRVLRDLLAEHEAEISD